MPTATIPASLKRFAHMIDEVDDERGTEGEGVWVHLKRGWWNPMLETHAVHEDNLRECATALRDCEECGCSACKPAHQTEHPAAPEPIVPINPALFPAAPARRMTFLAVIHWKGHAHALRNAAKAAAAGAHGVLLINMVGPGKVVLPSAQAVQLAHPNLLVGVNFLDYAPMDAVNAVAKAGLRFCWTDRQMVLDGMPCTTPSYAEVGARCKAAGVTLFAACAFKYQAKDRKPAASAAALRAEGLTPCTSGAGTGQAADPAHVASMRGSGEPLALASGVTARNVHFYAGHATHVLVGTSLLTDRRPVDEEFDPAKLAAMAAAVNAINAVQE